MAIQSQTSPSLISPKAKSYRDVKSQTVALRQQGSLAVQVAEALDTLQGQNNQMFQALQQGLPFPDEYQVLDANGKLVAAIGYIIGKDGLVYLGGFFRNLYIGPDGPDTAIFYSDGISVQIGKNGWISVLDPYDGISAWIGTQKDQTKAVTGAVNNGSGVIRLTVVAHNYTTGDLVNVLAVGGVPNATGQWVATVIDANHIDLVGSTWAGAYTSGGTVQRYFAGAAFEELAVGGATRITGAVNNGTGLIRITAVAHRLQTGWLATITGVGGVPNANGYWYVTRIDADHVDLQGSTFAGTYTSGGRLFAWAAANLRAQANGDLLINNALITLTGTGTNSATIVLDPTHGDITLTANDGTLELDLDAKYGLTAFAQAGSLPAVFVSNNIIQINESVTKTQAWPPVFTIAAGTSVTILKDEIILADAGGPQIELFASTGEISANGDISSLLKVAAGTVFNAAGIDGKTTSFGQATSLNVLSAGDGVFGTPGPGQSNGTVVQTVALVFTVRQFTGGIITT